jgi:hypothetical protein
MFDVRCAVFRLSPSHLLLFSNKQIFLLLACWPSDSQRSKKKFEELTSDPHLRIHADTTTPFISQNTITVFVSCIASDGNYNLLSFRNNETLNDCDHALPRCLVFFSFMATIYRVAVWTYTMSCMVLIGSLNQSQGIQLV